MAKKYPWEIDSAGTTATGLKNIQSATAAENFVKNLEQSFMASKGGEYSGMGARLSGAKKNIMGMLGLDTNAKVYNDARKGFAATLKTLTGDSGVMTEPDYERLAGLLPSLGATPEEAMQKFEQLRSQITAKFGGQESKTEYVAPENKGGLLSAVLPGLSGLYKQQQQQVSGAKSKLDQGDVLGYLKDIGGMSVKTAMPITNIYNPVEGYNPTGAKAAGEVLSMLGMYDAGKRVLGGIKGMGKNAALQNRSDVISKTTNQISGDDIYNEAKNYISKKGGIDKQKALDYLDQMKGDLVGKNLDADTVISKLGEANKAYTATSKVGKSAKALANDAISKSIRNNLPEELAKAQELVRKAYKRPQDLKKALMLTSMTAGGVGGGSYLLSLLLGKKK